MLRVARGRRLRGLELLNVSYNRVSSLEALREAERLKVLYARSNRVADLAPLAALAALRSLDLECNAIATIDALAPLWGLQAKRCNSSDMNTQGHEPAWEGAGQGRGRQNVCERSRRTRPRPEAFVVDARSSLAHCLVHLLAGSGCIVTPFSQNSVEDGNLF
eukprot:2483120-Pleurochrysis_carterae.AAC.2